MAGAEEVVDKRLANVYYLNNIIKNSFSHTNIDQQCVQMFWTKQLYFMLRKVFVSPVLAIA